MKNNVMEIPKETENKLKKNKINLKNEVSSNESSGKFAGNKRLEEFRKNHFEKRFIDLKDKFNENDIEILNKLGIEIEDKIYTEYEFELISMKLVRFFNEDKETGDIVFEEEKADNEFLRQCNVSPREFFYIIDKVYKVGEDYNL